MKRHAFAALAAIAVCVSAYAQQLPPGPLPTPQQTPPPQPLPQPRIRSDLPLTPLRQQTTLPVADFGAGDLRCSAALQGDTMQVGARLSVQPNPVRAGRATIDVLIDGVSIGPEELRIQNGEVTVSRRVSLSGGVSGQHEAVFVLEGAVRSAAQPFSHSCVALRETQSDYRPGVIQQQTHFSFVANVGDGLRLGNASGNPGSTLMLELETTDGRSFEFYHRGGIPDHSVVRIEGDVPLVLDRNTLHRVRLFIDGAPLEGLNAIADAGDSASFAWMLIETGRGDGPRPRIFETGAINLTIAPGRWWQTQVLSMRRVRGDTPITRLAVTIYTGEDDLRIGTWAPQYHSVIEVVTPIRTTLVPGAVSQTELMFGNWTDAEIQRRLPVPQPTGIPPALTAAEESRLRSAPTGDSRALRIQRMNRAFMMTPEGIRPEIGAQRPRPFGSRGIAWTELALPPGLTLRDIGAVFVRVDLGAGGSPLGADNIGAAIGQASIQADQWDYGGVTLSYRTASGESRLLYSDRRPDRVSSNRTFQLLVPDQTLRE